MQKSSAKSLLLLLSAVVCAVLFGFATLDGGASGQIDPRLRLPQPPRMAPTTTLRADCANNPDADADGDRAIACGGHDCDDRDSGRSSLVHEVCEGLLRDGRAAANVDEDCSPVTVAGRERSDGDRDHDGFTSHACTNRWEAYGPPEIEPQFRQVRLDARTRTVVGVDCDDALQAVVPGAQICGARGARVCSAAISPGLRLSEPSAEGYSDVACPAETRCIPQPNGLGVCG